MTHEDDAERTDKGKPVTAEEIHGVADAIVRVARYTKEVDLRDHLDRAAMQAYSSGHSIDTFASMARDSYQRAMKEKQR